MSTKKRSVDKTAARQMQSALKNTLDLFDGDAKVLLLSYLYKEHGLSIRDPDNLSKKKIESAFAVLFGRGADILIEKFNSEIRRAS